MLSFLKTKTGYDVRPIEVKGKTFYLAMFNGKSIGSCRTRAMARTLCVQHAKVMSA